LKNWFSLKLDENKALDLERIFKNMVFGDDIFSRQMEDLGNYLQQAAKEIYPLLKSNDLIGAEQKHKQFTECLEKRLDILSKSWDDLSKMEGEFRNS
jgi:hypothetical protein